MLGHLVAVLLAAALSGCSGTDLLNALTPGDSYRLQAGLSYGPLARQQADLYRPLAAPPAGGYPLVVFFYGGSWNRGQRGDYRFVGEALAARGIATLIADYRLYPEVRYPGFLKDCAAALDHALAMAPAWNANPERVFVAGHSAGAYNAAMLALDPRWLARHGRSPDQLAGWAGLAGPYDFIPVVNPEVRPVFHHPHTPADSQPVRHASASRLPAFLAVAADDQLVNPERNSQQLAGLLRAAGAKVDYQAYAEVSHTTLLGAFARPLRWRASVLEDLVQFVKDAAPATLR